MAKFLVVDDSSTMRKIVMKSIKGAFDEPPIFCEAGDGLEALEVLSKEEGIECIFCDVNMPNMDGIELVRTLRDQKLHASINLGDISIIKNVGYTIPILMITTEGGLEKVQEAMTAGANDYLKKPFTPAELAEKLKTLL